MTPLPLLLKRARAQIGLLFALLLASAILSFIVCGTLGYLSASSITASRVMLASAPASEAAMLVEAPLAADPAEQEVAATALFHRVFDGAHVRVLRTLRTAALDASGASGKATQLIAGTDPHLADDARIVDGSWPAARDGDAVPAALQATAASALGIRVGDELTVGSADARQRVRVVATWLPKDVSSPRWFGDPAAASGFADGAAGPLILDDASLPSLVSDAEVRWAIVPALSKLTPYELPSLAAAARSLEAEVKDSPTLGSSATTSGALAGTLAGIERASVASSSIGAVQLVLVLAIGFITLGSLARLLAVVRRNEVFLLVGRGSTRARMTTTALAESAAIVVPGCAAGTAAAGLVLPLVAGAASDWSWLWLQGFSLAVATVVLCAAVAWNSATVSHGRAAAGGSRNGATRSGERTVLAGLGILVTIVAGVSLWQFVLQSSGQFAGRSLDALAVLAPALCLIALALLCMLATGPALAVVQRLAARSAGISPVLPTRQLSRNPAVFGVAILTIVLSAGGTALAAGVAGTWSTTESAVAQLRNGADVRVRLDTQLTAGEGPPITAAPYAVLRSVTGAASVLAVPARIGSEDVDLTALSTSAMRHVMSSTDGRFDNDRVASLLSADPAGIALPEGASAVTVGLRATIDPNSAATIETAVWLADTDGSLARVSLGERPVVTLLAGATFTSALPSAGGRWRIIAVDAELSGGADETATVAFGRLVAAGAASEALPTLKISSEAGPALALVAPGRGGPLPVVITHALAEHLGVHTGDPLSFVVSTSGATVSARVVGQTDVVPGSEGGFALIADLPRLDEYSLRNGGVAAQSNEIWMSTRGDPEIAAAAAHGMVTTTATITTPATHSSRSLIDPAVATFWTGMCGAMLLGTMAVLAVVLSLSRQRRDEIAVLRALGMSRGQQTRARLAELGTVALIALVFGVLCGGIVAVLTAEGLSRVATDVPSVLSIGPRFAMLPLLGLLGLLVLALAVVAAVYGAVVHRSAGEGGSPR